MAANKMKYNSVYIIFVKKFAFSEERLGSRICCNYAINTSN